MSDFLFAPPPPPPTVNKDELFRNSLSEVKLLLIAVAAVGTPVEKDSTGGGGPFEIVLPFVPGLKTEDAPKSSPKNMDDELELDVVGDNVNEGPRDSERVPVTVPLLFLESGVCGRFPEVPLLLPGPEIQITLSRQTIN